MTARQDTAAPLAPPGSGPEREQDIDAVVVGVDRVADDTVAVTVRAAGGGLLPAWTAGAHTDVVLGPGLVRQYSLCGAPDDLRTWRFAVLRAPGSRGGSRRVHELAAGDRVRLRGPRNHFRLRPAPRYLFVAGGIGITPILPMLAAAERAGVPWTLHYGGRSRATMAFAEQLAAAHGARVVLRPQDEEGLLDLPTILGGAAPGTLLYCCGPEGLLSAVAAHTGRWPTGTVHTERFTPRTGTDDGADSAFEVECRASGVTVTVAPGRSVLDAVEAVGGVVVASSCREGVCGTCETSVLDGVPEHRDSVLDDGERAAGEVMMICVSRAASARLVLDL
ncbi:PDR/VanB family oxidoreductase [Pseudonocardia sp.]|uniref:PDR/VanB family oxidoreductase n=1 Tax=Pseudonocardia sp. TaxID=60912 RepID=UPI003D12F9E8